MYLFDGEKVVVPFFPDQKHDSSKIKGGYASWAYPRIKGFFVHHGIFTHSNASYSKLKLSHDSK